MTLKRRIQEDEDFWVRFYFYWTMGWTPLVALSAGTYIWWDDNLGLGLFCALSTIFMFRVWWISGNELKLRKYEASHGQEQDEGGTAKQD